MEMRVFSFVFFTLLVTNNVWSSEGETHVILIAGYNYYFYSYGFESAVRNMHTTLIKSGIKKENIITISPNTAAFDRRNKIPGILFYGKRDVTNDPADYKENIPIDYNITHRLSENQFYDILRGESSSLKNTGTGRVLKSTAKDTVIIYYVGAGTFGLLTLRNGVYLFADDFIPLLEELSGNKFKQLIMFVDACQTGTSFDNYLDPHKKVFVFTNAARYDCYNFCNYNRMLSAFTSTCFSYALSSFFESVIQDHRGFGKMNLFDLANKIESFPNVGIPTYYGDLKLGKFKLEKTFGTFNAGALHTSSEFESMKFHLSHETEEQYKDDPFSDEQRQQNTIAFQTTMNKIVSEVTKEADFKVGSEFTRKYDNSKFACYKSAVKSAHKYCFNSEDEINSLPIVSKFAELCESNISESEILKAVIAVCGNN